MPGQTVSDRAIAERRYTVFDHARDESQEVTYRIFAPEIEDDGGYLVRVTVTQGEDERTYDMAVACDAWSALDTAFGIARVLIVRMHEMNRGKTIMMDGRVTAGWI